MPKVIVTTRENEMKTINAKAGVSLMVAIRDSGIDELAALCGGSCSCATCHVYVDLSFIQAVLPMSDDENDLLDVSSHRRETSRLSCQIRLVEALDGLKVTIAAAD
jgi:2Fe-2S ferredoxin